MEAAYGRAGPASHREGMILAITQRLSNLGTKKYSEWEVRSIGSISMHPEIGWKVQDFDFRPGNQHIFYRFRFAGLGLGVGWRFRGPPVPGTLSLQEGDAFGGKTIKINQPFSSLDLDGACGSVIDGSISAGLGAGIAYVSANHLSAETLRNWMHLHSGSGSYFSEQPVPGLSIGGFGAEAVADIGVWFFVPAQARHDIYPGARSPTG